VARRAVGGETYFPCRNMVCHCRSMRGVGDSRRRGMVKKERERVFPARRAEAVMPRVCARRIGRGTSVGIS